MLHAFVIQIPDEGEAAAFSSSMYLVVQPQRPVETVDFFPWSVNVRVISITEDFSIVDKVFHPWQHDRMEK